MLNICYIVKNSIFKLPKVLDVMSKLSRDIIVIDTGSTDGTKEWLKSKDYAKVYDFEWCDDFSKARNFALSKCDKKFTLMMDDDEVVPVDYHQAVNNFVNNLGQDKGIDIHFALSFNIYNYLQDPAWVKGPKVLEGTAVRLFETAGAEYHKKVHERLKLPEKTTNIPSEIPIVHMAYLSAGGVINKMEYYRRLIKEEYDKNDVLDNLHIANTFREQFRWTGKKDAANKAIFYLKLANKIKSQKFIIEEIQSLKKAVA